MDSDFFERAVTADKIQLDEEHIPALAQDYKKNISGFEEFALDFISRQPVPVLNPFSKVDSTGKLNKCINGIKSKKLFPDDLASAAVNLVAVTDLFVCSLVNDSLIHIFKRQKDRSKMKYYTVQVQGLWHRFLLSSSDLTVEMVDPLRHFLYKWNDMLKGTEHCKIFGNVTITANDKYKSLKNLKDKKTGMKRKHKEEDEDFELADLEQEMADLDEDLEFQKFFDSFTNKSKTVKRDSIKSDVKKEHVKSEVKKSEIKPDPKPDSIITDVEIVKKSLDVKNTSPAVKKPKIDIRNYFGKKNEDEKVNENNNKILTEKLDLQFSPVKKSKNEVEIVKEKKEEEVEIISPAKENKILKVEEVENSDLGKTPPKVNAFQRLMESAKKKRSMQGIK